MKAPPAKLISALNKVREQVGRIHQKLVPPPVAALDFVSQMWTFHAVVAAVKLEIPDLLAPGPRDVEYLAEKCGAQPEALYRLLRALTNVDVFAEERERVFRQTPISESLRKDVPRSMRDMILFQGEHSVHHWLHLERAVRTGKEVVGHIRGGKSLFEYLHSDSETMRTFDGAMTNVSGLAVDALVAAYDFSRVKTIADIGGGHGRLLSAMLQAHPHLQGTLFDLPQVLEGAPRILREQGVDARARLEGGSFFEKIPVEADVFFLKHIIHDWSDEESVRILSNVRAQMRQTSRVVLIESAITPPGVPHFAKILDLEMLVNTTGHERTIQQYSELFHKAGLRLSRVLPTASIHSMIEAEL